MNRTSLRPALPMLLIFVILNGLFISSKSLLARYGIDQGVVVAGNVLVFLVCLASYLMTRRSLDTPSGNAFVRGMYTGFIIKFFVIAIAAFVYISINDGVVNKRGLFVSMGLYVLYTAIEVSALLKLLKSRKNA